MEFIFVAGYYIIAFLPYALIFKKANVAVWKAFVPFYNLFVFGNVAKNRTYGAIYLMLGFFFFGKEFDIVEFGLFSEYMSSSISFVIGFAFLAISLFLLYFIFLVHTALVDRFSRGLGCKILICIPIINWFVMMYLGLSKNCIYTKYEDKRNLKIEESEITLKP